MDEFKFGESFQDKDQEINEAPKLEDYDANDGLGQPGIDPNNIPQPSFLDVNNPASYQQPQQPQQQPFMPQYQIPTGPNFEAVKKNGKGIVSQISNIMEVGNNMTPNTDGQGNVLEGNAIPNNSQSIGIAIKSLNDAIKVLEGVEYWIPAGKEEYVDQLKQIAVPILKALKPYANKVEQLR